MKQLLTSLTALLLVSGGCTPDEEPEATIRIDLARRGADIPASMYGIFFEEINHAGDGGLYAELSRTADSRTRPSRKGIP